MRKVFSIEWDENVYHKIFKGKIEIFLKSFLSIVNGKITELPQPTEYCECGNRPRTSIGALNQDITKMDICAICKKKVKPKPKIEKLKLNEWLNLERDKQVYDKINEIIDKLEKEGR